MGCMGPYIDREKAEQLYQDVVKYLHEQNILTMPTEELPAPFMDCRKEALEKLRHALYEVYVQDCCELF
jgi:hypothetical protein